MSIDVEKNKTRYDDTLDLVIVKDEDGNTSTRLEERETD